MRVTAAAAAILVAAQMAAATPEAVSRAVEKVHAASAYGTVERLSSPEFGGRLTGTPGYAAAAGWMADQLRAAGLRPPEGWSGMLQEFPVVVSKIDAASMSLEASGEGKNDGRRLEFFEDFLPMLFSGSGDVTAEVVFVGYGITAPERGRDDYAGADVNGKIVMAVRGAPDDGRDWRAHDSHRARTANARAHGAAGFVFAESAVANPNGEPIADLPMVTVTEAVADTLLDGSGLKLAEVRRVLVRGGVATFSTGRRVHLAVAANPPHAAAGANVVAVLPGSDPAVAGEYVLVGAHLDHCGDWPVLLPGADDNASGSATVLEIARAAAGLPLRRSMVFALFGGEEMGLLGSTWLAGHPPRGLEHCVGMFNLDMVGAGTGAYVSGGKNFPALFELLTGARDRVLPGADLRAGLATGEPRADHGPFQALGIPAVSIFGMGGSHHGYHSGEDSIWWITPKTMEGIGRVVLDAAVTLADR